MIYLSILREKKRKLGKSQYKNQELQESEKWYSKSIEYITKLLIFPISSTIVYFIILGLGINLSFQSKYIDFIHNSGSEIFSTLAVLQATIFAIVFSVVILGVQLSSTKYSPRLVELFINDTSYRKTVLFFAFSIGFSVFGLYLFPLENFVLLITAYIIIAGVYALSAFFRLYCFVNKTLKNTTPEGILKQIRHELLPELIVKKANDKKNSKLNRDPFQVIESIILSFIRDKDTVASVSGLKILEEKISELIQETDPEEFEKDSPLDESLEKLCKESIPNFVEESIEEQLTESATEVNKTIKRISETAIENKVDTVFDYLIDGQTSLIAKIGFEKREEIVRREIIDSVSNTLETAKEAERFTPLYKGNRLLGFYAAGSVMDRRGSQARDLRYSTLLILHFPDIMKLTGKKLEDHTHNDWMMMPEPSEDAKPVEKFIGTCYGSMTELTSAMLRFEIRTQKQIGDWGSISAGWNKGLKNLPSKLTNLRELWLGTMLYLEYLSYFTSDDVMQNFSIMFGDISSDFMKNTITKIRKGNLRPCSQVDMIPGYIDPIELPLTGYKKPPISDAEIDFHKWLKNRPIYEYRT